MAIDNHGTNENDTSMFGTDYGIDALLAGNDAGAKEAKSINNVAIILSCISKGINTAGEIASYTSASRSTVHRILRGLERSLLVVQDPTSRRYFLGALIRKLVSEPIVTHEYLVYSAMPEMLRLAGTTGETILLCVKIGLYHAFLHTIPSSHEFRIANQTNRMGPLHKGAGGKVLLAQLGNEDLKNVIKHISFEFGSPSEKEALLNEINAIRQRGYAIDTNGRIQFATFISAPVRGYEVPVEVSIVGLEAQIGPHRDAYIERLLETTDRISKILMEQKR